jgi:hypothetical protein
MQMRALAFNHTAVVVPVGQVVAGVGEAQPAALRVEDGVQAGHEHIRWNLVHQYIVDAPEHRPGRLETPGGSAQHAARCSHHQRGRHALVGDIADHQAQPAIRQLDEIVEVAANLARRLVVAVDLPAGQGGNRARQQRLLHQVGNTQLLGDSLALERFDLLLAHELGHAQRRSGLHRQVAQQPAIVR